MKRLVVRLAAGAAVVMVSAFAFAQKQPTVSDIATCNNEAASTAGPTDSTVQLVTETANPRLEGMAAARAADPAYRAAYGECMRRLGY